MTKMSWMLVLLLAMAVLVAPMAIADDADDEGDVEEVDNGNTDVVDGNGCCKKEEGDATKLLGDLLLIGVALTGLAAISAIRK